MAETAFPGEQLDLSRLNRVLLSEIRDFRSDFEDTPVPAVQDLRAGAIAWIAVFAPEAVGAAVRQQLSLTCAAIREPDDYPHHGWYRAVYLDVAQYSLTGKAKWLDTLVTNPDQPAETQELPDLKFCSLDSVAL